MNFIPKVKILGEPQLERRGLYPTISTKTSGLAVRNMMDFITYSDGTNDLVDICNIIKVPYWQALPFIAPLLEKEIIEAL